MGIGRRVSAATAAACLAFTVHAQLTDNEKALVHSALSFANMDEGDLKWDRRPFTDPYRLPLVNEALDTPFEAADTLMALHKKLASSAVDDSLRVIEQSVFRGKWAKEDASIAEDPTPGLPPDIGRPIAKLAVSVRLANDDVKAALSNLTAEEVRQLIESLPQLAAEESSIKFDFVKQPAMPLTSALRLLDKVDFVKIRAAAAMLSTAVEACADSLARSKSDVAQPVTIRLNNQLVRIYGRGHDLHSTSDAMIEIDLGGNDEYEGRMGAGIGYAAAAIDLGGNDTYRTKDASVGGAILGIGIMRDESGDDHYETSCIGEGSALGGVGVLVDASGDDTYRSTCFAQGFGTFGVGLLIDAAGSDVYDVKLYGQGAGRTSGVGALADRAGADIYRAGGLIISAPLFADVHYSFAQGFGTGYREDTGGISGGIGLLTDLQGDDNYLAETYAQGASYWFSIGSLYDESGIDTYSGYHYVQASAMHLTGAFLFDLAGDDAYSTKFGASLAIGHDYGVAMLLDRAGNDTYFAKDSTPGIGKANGLGIFIDTIGDDRYQGPPGRGNPARGSGSFGLFVDGSGQDVYRDGLGDASAAISDSWGAAYDAPTPKQVSTDNGAPAPTKRPTPGSIPNPGEAGLEAIFSKAVQWGVGTAQAEVEENIGKLVGIGMPAVNFMLDKHLAAADRLQIRAYVQVIGDVGPEARAALASRIAKGSIAEKRNGLSIAVDGGFTEAAPMAAPLIKTPELQLQAIRAAGALKAKEAVPDLMALAASPGNIGLSAMTSLSQIGDESAYTTAEALLKTRSLLMRKAAMSLLIQFPHRATETAKQMLLQGDERGMRIAVEMLGLVNTEESLGLAASHLLDPVPGVRIQTLFALNGKCPDDARLTFMSLRNDPDPMVRAAAQRVTPGR